MIRAFKKFLKTALPAPAVQGISKLQTKTKAFIFQKSLPKLASLYFTDKWNIHWYAGHYQHPFQGCRTQKLNVLEIGVGGFADPKSGGESLRMWKAYFRKSTIYGIDLYDKKAIEEDRIRTFQGSQEDAGFLRRASDEAGGFDIIVDDGSHVNCHVIETFHILFPRLKDGGIYVVEDTQSSYWPGFGGSSDDLTRADTLMNFFKGLADGLNYEEFVRAGYAPTYYDQHITSMHFYHNMIFIYKGENREGSNMLEKNRPLEDSIVKDYRKAPGYQKDPHV